MSVRHTTNTHSGLRLSGNEISTCLVVDRPDIKYATGQSNQLAKYRGLIKPQLNGEWLDT